MLCFEYCGLLRRRNFPFLSTFHESFHFRLNRFISYLTSIRILIMDLEDFHTSIQFLKEQLEEAPDAWFSSPSGNLMKPDFKRKEQLLQNLSTTTQDDLPPPPTRGFGLMKQASSMVFRSSKYNTRYFVLEGGSQLVYYKDENASTASGSIDLTEIEKVTPSHVVDAPPDSLDLVGEERVFTLAAEGEEEMLRWALVLQMAIDNLANQEQQQEGGEEDEETKKSSTQLSDDSKWINYSVTFSHNGPLHLNVRGVENRDESGQVLNHWIIVSGFETPEDGSIGEAEKSGKIKVKDILVGVNQVDLTVSTFNACMKKIKASSWPLTLNFLRDATMEGVEVIKEGWGRLTAGTISRKRRYLELMGEELSFTRPTPGGAAQSMREGFINAPSINLLRCEKNYALKEGYFLKIKPIKVDFSQLLYISHYVSLND